MLSRQLLALRFYHLRINHQIPRKCQLSLLAGAARPLLFRKPSSSWTSQGVRTLSLSSITSWFTGSTADPQPLSTDLSPPSSVDIGFIPEPPTGLPLEETAQELVLNHLGEPTLASLGLGNAWMPSGWVQLWLEYLHVECGLPWWGTIVCTTIIIRTLMFPLLLKQKKILVKNSNIMPKIGELQKRLSDAKNSNNFAETMKCSMEMQNFANNSDFRPIQSMLIPLFQMPVFLSFLFGLKGMAELPVVSMQTGGLFWFQDLTMSDPYYIFPIVTAVTLSIMLEVGADFGTVKTMDPKMKWMMRVMPFTILIFIKNYPMTVTFYWMISNFCSLIQSMIMLTPAFKKRYKMPERASLEPSQSKQGMVQKMKQQFKTQRLTTFVDQREEIDDRNWKNAAKEPIVQTFSYDPTKVKSPPKIIAIKKKA